MNAIKMLVGGLILGATLLLTVNADAQWSYTNDKGVSKTVQYKLDIPVDYRDGAVFVGQTGVGEPSLSTEMNRRRDLDNADRRIIDANGKLLKYGTPRDTAANEAKRNSSAQQSKMDGLRNPLATMCVAGEYRVMTSPGQWTVMGQCFRGD
jgi:hypothetical protein